MKARIALFLLALSAVALAAWEVFMLSGKVRTHAFVYNETGLRLPAEVRIVSTRSHLFSLVDGVNYEWLIQACRTDWIVQSDYEWMTQAPPVSGGA